MLPYDLPVQNVSCRPSGNVCKKKNKKGKALRFAVWQTTTLALALTILTFLRYIGWLAPLVESARRALGL